MTRLSPPLKTKVREPLCRPLMVSALTPVRWAFPCAYDRILYLWYSMSPSVILFHNPSWARKPSVSLFPLFPLFCRFIEAFPSLNMYIWSRSRKRAALNSFSRAKPLHQRLCFRCTGFWRAFVKPLSSASVCLYVVSFVHLGRTLAASPHFTPRRSRLSKEVLNAPTPSPEWPLNVTQWSSTMVAACARSASLGKITREGIWQPLSAAARTQSSRLAAMHRPSVTSSV